jgi:hypothetical protein
MADKETLIEVEYVGNVTIYHFIKSNRDAFDEYLRLFKAEMQKHVDAGKQDQLIRLYWMSRNRVCFL